MKLWLFLNPMTQLLNLTTAKLKRIIVLKQQIEKLQSRLEALAGGSAAPATKTGRTWTMSLSGRRKIAAAARARWAKIKGAKSAPKKRHISAAARAKMAAAAKARWAKVKAAKG